MKSEGKPVSTQEILNSGEFPILKGFIVRHGKVSDCIFGGKGEFVIPAEEAANYQSQLKGLPVDFIPFFDKTDKNKEKIRISFENPPLITKVGIPAIIMLRTGRISTHDIERGRVPFKDQVLALNHDFMRHMVMPFLGSSQFDLGLPPNSVVIMAEKLWGMDYENVLRSHMAKSTTVTSLYHAYVAKGERVFAGYDLSNNFYPNGPLLFIMDTPSTKDNEHDVTVAPKDLFDLNICTPQEYYALRNNSLAAYGAVTTFLLSRGIIMADTKTEHGFNRNGLIKTQDELYTMDSSRFWLYDDYYAQQQLYLAGDEDGLVAYLKTTQPKLTEKDYTVNGRIIMVPRSYSKEFARGLSVKDEKYTDEQRAAIAVRYIMGIQHLLRARFEPDMRPWSERVIAGMRETIKQLFDISLL